MALRRPASFVLALLVCTTAHSNAWAEEEVVLTEEGGSAPAKAPSQPVVEENAGVMVRPFSGPKAQTIHDKVISTLEAEGIILIPEGFEEGVKLADAPGPYIEVARKNQIKAYLHGQTKMTRREWAVTLKVRNAADGKPVSSVTLKSGSLPGLLKKIDKELMSTLDEHLLKTQVPGAKPAKGGGAKKADKEDESGALEVSLDAEGESSGGDVAADTGPIEPKPDAATGDAKPSSPLDVFLGVGLIQRDQKYQKPLGDVYEYGLKPHNMMVPTLRVGAHWYPGAHFYDGLPANIGIALNLYQSVGGSTQARNASGGTTKLSTAFSEFNAGLRGRIPLRGMELGLNGGWGKQSLKLSGDNEVPPGQTEPDLGVVPDFGYTYFRFGADAHFEIGAPIEVGLFYRTLTLDDKAGFVAEPRWFPAAAGVGVDAYAAFDIPVADRINLQIGGEARYYGLKANPGSYDSVADPNGNINPLPADPAVNHDGLNQAVAAGITDLYLGAFVSGTYTLPGAAH